MSPMMPGRPFQHGYSAYFNGICRCPICRKAGTDYAREYRARRRAQGHPTKRDNIKHGTEAAYKYDHCKCSDCRWAKTKADVERRERQRQQKLQQGGWKTMHWRHIKPEDAVGLDLTQRTDITAPLNEQGERCPWPWEPQQLAGTPMGQYHCPFCGAMVIAGMPHTDYKDQQ